MEFLGIKWVGLNAENGQKLLLSFVFIFAVLLFGAFARWATRLVTSRTDHAGEQTRFWTRQAISLVAAIVLILGLLSIWFNDPTRLTTAFGLMSAGLAFALQQVITAFAGYFVILRGATFTVGDRISMGGVRGDVLQLAEDLSFSHAQELVEKNGHENCSLEEVGLPRRTCRVRTGLVERMRRARRAPRARTTALPAIVRACSG